MSTFIAASGNGVDYLGMKIGRAEKHFKEFDSLVVAHAKRPNPYTVTAHDDGVSGRYVISCQFPLVDGDIPLSLGDFIYALRSGLDQLIWQLSLLTNPSPSRKTQFPIHHERTEASERTFRENVWDVPCEAVEIIKDLQPYKDGCTYRSHPLWQLNELSNIDKHRLPAGSCTTANFDIKPLGYLRREIDNGFEVSWPLALKDTVVFQPYTPMLAFGDPIDSTSSRTPIEVSRIEIAEIYRYVREDVAPRFTRFFP